MTAWIVGHDTRWRCAVLGNAAVDWVEAYDLSGNGDLAWSRDSLGGSPWESMTMMQRYRDGSPIIRNASPHADADPTGLADQVVPLSESWAFYHALRDNHVPVHLVGIPSAHHTPRHPVRRESYEQRSAASSENFVTLQRLGDIKRLSTDVTRTLLAILLDLLKSLRCSLLSHA